MKKIGIVLGCLCLIGCIAACETGTAVSPKSQLSQKILDFDAALDASGRVWMSYKSLAEMWMVAEPAPGAESTTTATRDRVRVESSKTRYTLSADRSSQQLWMQTGEEVQGRWYTESKIIQTDHGYLTLQTQRENPVVTECIGNESEFTAYYELESVRLADLAAFPDEATVSFQNNIYTVSFPILAMGNDTTFAAFTDLISILEGFLSETDSMTMTLEFTQGDRKVDIGLNSEVDLSDSPLVLSLDLDLAVEIPTAFVPYEYPNNTVILTPSSRELASVESFDPAVDNRRQAVLADDYPGWLAYDLEPGFYRFSGTFSSPPFYSRLETSSGKRMSSSVAPVAKTGRYYLRLLGSGSVEVACSRYPVEQIGTPLSPILAPLSVSDSVNLKNKYYLYQPSDVERTMVISISSVSARGMNLNIHDHLESMVAGKTIYARIDAGEWVLFWIQGAGDYSFDVAFE